MNKKMSKRQKDIKSKLMAAIAMLLVSSIMMVSTTYAWFTLSTAPEVTGISTAVGANGNLEMALLPVYGNVLGANQDYGVKSGTDDSMAIANKSAKDANITWGNLVDLTDLYGLEDVTLYPSEINDNEAGNAILSGGVFLKTPKYGTDGRIAELVGNGIVGIYDEAEGKALQSAAYTLEGTSTTTDDPTGVRLIGTASGMTDRQLDHRNALSDASGAANDAKEAARVALDANGDSLGAIAVKYVKNKEAATFDSTDKQALTNVVNALKGTDAQKGSLQYIEDALRHYIYAYQVSINDSYEDTEVTIFGDDTTAAKALDSDALKALMPEGMKAENGMLSVLAASNTAVNTASTNLATLPSDNIPWSSLKTALDPLMNIEKMKINNNPVTDETGAFNDDLMSEVMTAFGTGQGITLELASGSGVFADIADFAGQYSASVTVYAGDIMDGADFNVTPTMIAPGINPTYLNQARTWAQTATIPGAAEGSEAITDYYGYVIDLAFRTNAANSELRLQTEAVDRYSDESTSEDTMGSGATFIFKSNDTTNGFDDSDVKALLKHMRVVFFNPADNNSIIAYGVPDESHFDTLDGGYISIGMAIARSPVQVENEEGELEYDLIENNRIMDLEQNKLHRLSVLVYLDGTTITNKDVAIGADSSMSGRLNLQFSSSANLVPMKYTDFQSIEGTTTPTTPSYTFATYDTNKVNLTGDGYTVAAAGFGTSTAGNAIGVKLTKDSAVVSEGVNVTIGGEDAIYNATTQMWVAATTATEAPESVAVTVTAAKYDVTLNGATTENAATHGVEYTIVVPEGHTLTKVEVGGTDVTTSVTENKIPAASVTGDIVITTTEASN